MITLAIESSCDETSVAITKDSNILSNVISSQFFHGKFGGVIPELASRAHLQYIHPICQEALKRAETSMQDVDAIAVTSEPGLLGSLIVGANFAKALALRYNKPIIPVNHIEGHLFSASLQNHNLEFPYVTLVVSGGHTTLFLVKSFEEYDILGSTVDDAAGEAFDKIATMLGLEYPGGPKIDKIAKDANPKAYDFPRSMIGSKDYNFSFSGLKTSVRYFLAKEFGSEIPQDQIPDLCASVQEAIVDVLVKKTLKAALEFNVKTIVLGGGVSANSRLRKKMENKAQPRKIQTIAPELILCMDNAAMIAFIAEQKAKILGLEHFNDLTFTVSANALRAKKKKRTA